MPTPTSLPTSSRGSSRECRRVVQLATGITSIARVGRMDVGRVGRVGVGVGVVECDSALTCISRFQFRAIGYVAHDLGEPLSS